MTEDTAGPEVAALAERLQALLLNGERTYTAAEVAERAGVDRDFSHQLWRSLGFANVAEDDVMFTDYDVDALEIVKGIRDRDIIDDSLRDAMARFVGQVFARLASWQGQLILELMASRPELLSSEHGVVDLVEELMPQLDELQRYVWRRQLAAYLDRLATMTVDNEGESSLAVGFADLASFTSLTRRVDEAELRTILDVFEQIATEAVGTHRGRIVKTIGDEVLFTAPDPAAGAEIALELLDRAVEDERLPRMRVGLACGPVISRLGDVYGETVNIAARLTSLGKPGHVLVDRNVHDALEHDPRFQLGSRRTESVRGYGHLRQWRLRRAERG
jgi:adenylate cyclase